MKNKLLATLRLVEKTSKMKSQFRGCLRLGFFLLIAASVLPTTALVAQCSVSNTLIGFQMNSYTSSGQSFVPTCTNTLYSVSFQGGSGVSLPDRIDVIYGEPGNSGGTLYSVGNPQWSGNTHTLIFPVSVLSGQTYTVLFIRQSTSNPCHHFFINNNPIPSGRLWGYTGTYNSGSWSAVDADFDLTCNFNIGSCIAPAFTACPLNLTVNTGSSTCDAAVSYTATASGTPAPALTYTFSGATTGSGSGTGSGSTFNRGVTTVLLSATSSCGSSTCSFTVTVNDATAPTITCPANVDIPVNPACAGFIGMYTPVSVSDNCTANPTVTQSPVAGTTLIGHGNTQTIRLTATDASSNTQTCTFTATLKDVTPPTITCKNATVNLDNSGAASITTSDVFQSGADNCGTVNQVSVLPNTFSCTNIGTNTVALAVNDGHGNTNTCTASVTITDNSNVCAPLPVELVNLTAIAETQSIQLHWQTASERNNAGFQVERSENGRDFKQIAFVPGAGKSAEKHTYQLEDKNVRTGQPYFYRLQQLDNDGTAQYSAIVQATLSGGKMTLAVFPNPVTANGILQLNISLLQASEVVITLFDLQGNLLRTERHDLEADLQTLPISINDLSANTYFLKVTANGESVYQKLIITR